MEGGGNGRKVGKAGGLRGWAGVGKKGRKLYLNNNKKIKIIKECEVFSSGVNFGQ